LQLGYPGRLVPGQNLGDHLVDAELTRDPPSGRGAVAGKHDDANPRLVECGNAGGGGGDLNLTAVPDHDRPRRGEVEQSRWKH